MSWRVVWALVALFELGLFLAGVALGNTALIVVGAVWFVFCSVMSLREARR